MSTKRTIFKDKLKSEGFAHVYDWTDKAGTTYSAHAHKGKVSFYVTLGSIAMKFEDREVIVKTGERMDVPVGATHIAIVGPEGCTFVVGEEIEGDS